jgi:DNA polymerase-3 subunit gamma/tau
VRQSVTAATEKKQPIETKPSMQHRPDEHPGGICDSGWPQLVQQLKLTGMAKMLAQHCEAQTVSAEKAELCVPEAHKHLLEKKYQDKIQAALNAHFGKPVTLKFSVGAITGLTPVALQQRAEEQKQADAIAAMESDPVVQELIEQFDAKLIVPTIKPIQK